MKLPPDFAIPRDYQIDFLESAVGLIRSNPDQWHLYTSPTGTGKSYMWMMLLAELENSILMTPRIEIIGGMLEKLGHEYVDLMSVDEIVTLAWNQYNIITPIRLRNILARGELPFLPSVLCIDECHHDLSDSYQDITMYLNGVPKIGLTATAFRGTPQGTKKFLDQWGDTVNVVLSLKDAIEQGYCSLPTTELWPLVDDDIISVTGGEFKVAAADPIIRDRIAAIVSKSEQYYCRRSGYWDRPTMYSVPSSTIAVELYNALIRSNIPAAIVTQNTTRAARSEASQNTVACISCLVQIDVVSEGVDLPIRRLIDVKPTMSPVRWVQQIGRIMRPTAPGEDAPHYVCCCRNLERHGYLMEGMLPSTAIADAQTIFDGKPSKRSGSRSVGLEGLGKFTTTPVQLLNGMTVFTYHLVHVEGYDRCEYFVIQHPNSTETVKGMKVSSKDPETNEMKWGKWKLIEELPPLTGCQTATARPLTQPMLDWWNKPEDKGGAVSYGLNPHTVCNNRSFAILPFLANTGVRFR